MATRGLADCPQGDSAWRAALGASVDDEALARLESTARRAAFHCPDRWEPLWAAGESLFRRSRYADARDPFAEALVRARRLSDATGIACAANRLGSLAYLRGELDTARESFEEALSAARKAARADLRAFVLNNLAGLLKERGELAASATHFEEAVGTLQELGLAQPARAAAYNLAVLRMNLGDLSGARDNLERLRGEAEEAGDAEVASSASLALGNLLLTTGDADAALGWYERATAETAQIAVSREMALGRLALAQGSLEEAERRLGTAVRLGRESELKLDALLAEVWSVDVLLKRGHHAAAIERLRQVEFAARKADSTQYALWLARWQAGRAWRAAGDWARAEAAFHEAVDLLESQAAQLTLSQEGLYFLLGRSDPYTDLADALVQRDPEGHELATATAVLETMERSHARRLRRAFANWDASPSARPTIEAIQTSLRQGELLLQYLMGRDRGVLLVVTPVEARAVSIDGWSSIAVPLARWREALVRPLDGSLAALVRPAEDLARDVDAGATLRRALLDPIGPALADARRIWVVPDGELALLPLATLPGTETEGLTVRHIGESIEFGTLPMAGAIPRGRALTGPVLVAGRPVGGAGALGPLARAAAEMDGVEAIWSAGPTERLEGESFVREDFVRLRLERFAAIHLATHGVASSVDPRRCAVIFSHGERLGFDEIARLRLDGSLVVLSACRSGEGEVIPGQGVVGLGWAFLAAGARELVVSLWGVDDAAAADLMIEFHRRLHAGDDAVRALAQAQASVRLERSHPAYWAPFIVITRPVH